MYVAGPMSGLPDYNRGAFSEVTQVLRDQYYGVINPAELGDTPDMKQDGRKLWHKYLRRDIKYLMDCDAVVALEGWAESDGAKLEVSVAFELGMPIYRMRNDKLELIMHAPHRAERMG
jgi:nucleoside 2-deoxyribosyltransferase